MVRCTHARCACQESVQPGSPLIPVKFFCFARSITGPLLEHFTILARHVTQFEIGNEPAIVEEGAADSCANRDFDNGAVQPNARAKAHLGHA